MFEKTLTDVVKGIRSSKRDTALYISQCIAEIKTEISSSDMHVKSNALQKLTFLQMMGYSMSWASFASIEVMSSPRFAHKRIGYLAASQGFNQDTDVILLTTNLLKKELRGAIGGGMTGVYEAGLAINCISNIVTQELACDLLPELTNLTSHPQPYLRKKAILCLFKLFVKYPQALRLTFTKIQQCVQDPDPAVVSCAVNVITELSDKNPKNYLHLAPAFFDLLTRSSNNWMLIKVVKLLGSLVPEEPRLARKLLEPLANIVKNTKAKSLLFEAVHTITLCLPYCRKSDGTMPVVVPELVVLCAQTLRDLVEETDQNLKYLGLVGFGSLMKSHPRVLSAPDYRPLILACLSDQDVTIRSRALDLLTGMASRKNLMELVTQLLQHVELATGTYKHDLVAKIIEMCAGDKYALLQDFAWYLDLVFRIGHMRGVEPHGDLLRAQVTDVALRVLPVRPFAVRRSIEILLEKEGSVSDDPYGDNGRGKHIMPDILPALAWIVGEYSDLIREAIAFQDEDDDGDEEEFFFDEDSQGSYHAIIQALTDPGKTQRQPASTQKVFVQAAMKVLAAASADGQVSNVELEACVEAIHDGFSIYMQSPDVEVVQRSFASVELLKSLDLGSHPLQGVPGLTLVDENSDDDDLLGKGGKEKPASNSFPKHSVPNSLASRLRNASSTLCSILKPAPMKPVGAKAQKKKRDVMIGAGIDLEQPVDMSVFREFVDEELAYRKRGKLTVESVCFTQQQPLKAVELSSLESSETVRLDPTSQSPQISTDGATSFQHPSAGVPLTAVSRQRQGDPFYLDSGQKSGGEDDRGPNRFGTIQLVDSDDEQETPKKAKRKKEKKSRRPKQQDSLLIGEAGQSRLAASVGDSVEVYDSDDDEDGFLGNVAVVRGKKGKKNPHGKEFAGLAQVDLTTPLRDDEVMPVRKHRVVPERPLEQAAVTLKSKKKSKKSKKAKSNEGLTATVGDLLDLSDFVDMNSTAGGFTGITGSQPAPPNPISSAFDDLLGMTMPSTPMADLPSNLSTSHMVATKSIAHSPFEGTVPSERSSRRPWMSGNVKASSASQSPVDWSAVSLKYRCYRTSQGDGLGLMLSFCVSNNSGSALVNASLLFKDIEPLELGSIAPGGTTETGKIGPFFFSHVDDSQSVKGSLRTSEGSGGIKVVLPAWFHLRPEEDLSLDHIADELASPGWSSHSAKVDLPSGVTPEDVKQGLCSFFRAAAVAESPASPSAGTFAALSGTGVRVRFLVKVKERSVKVDVKATNGSLAKAIASDIKRIIL